MVRRANVVPPLPTHHNELTQKLLTAERLPINTPLGITTSGKVRHIVMWQRKGEQVDVLCHLFRPGTSLLRMSTPEDEQPICEACAKTLEAEVMRAKEAMRGELDEEDYEE